MSRSKFEISVENKDHKNKMNMSKLHLNYIVRETILNVWLSHLLDNPSPLTFVLSTSLEFTAKTTKHTTNRYTNKSLTIMCHLLYPLSGNLFLIVSQQFWFDLFSHITLTTTRQLFWINAQAESKISMQVVIEKNHGHVISSFKGSHNWISGVITVRFRKA